MTMQLLIAKQLSFLIPMKSRTGITGNS